MQCADVTESASRSRSSTAARQPSSATGTASTSMSARSPASHEVSTHGGSRWWRLFHRLAWGPLGDRCRAPRRFRTPFISICRKCRACPSRQRRLVKSLAYRRRFRRSNGARLRSDICSLHFVCRIPLDLGRRLAPPFSVRAPDIGGGAVGCWQREVSRTAGDRAVGPGDVGEAAEDHLCRPVITPANLERARRCQPRGGWSTWYNPDDG